MTESTTTPDSGSQVKRVVGLTFHNGRETCMAKMKTNLVELYKIALPREIDAADNSDEIISFLNGIDGKVVELIFTAGDAFERADDNFWLPNSLWDRLPNATANREPAHD